MLVGRKRCWKFVSRSARAWASVVVLLTVLLFNDVLFKLSSCEFYNAVGSVTWRFSR